MSLEQPKVIKNLAYYCEVFSKLNPSKNKTVNAPYQPILLLSVIDLITQGAIEDNYIYVSEELINTFNKYWHILASDSPYKGGLHYPFIHLESQGFWHLEFNPECKRGRKIGTTKALQSNVKYATLDEELFALIKEPNSANILINVLIDSWFSSKRGKIEDILMVNQNFLESTQEELALINDNTTDYTPKTVLRKSVIRNAFFRKAIVHLYDYRCAFCRLRVIRTFTQNIVDGAHIKPFSQFFDSRVNNGISLCKNHHWAFDQGWVAIDDNYKILVASDLEEESPNGKLMKDFHGEVIFLPSLEQYLPRLDALQWHRLNVFRF